MIQNCPHAAPSVRAALPLIVEDASAFRHGGPPTEMHADQRGFRLLDADRHDVCGRLDMDGNVGAVLSAFAGERYGTAFGQSLLTINHVCWRPWFKLIGR